MNIWSVRLYHTPPARIMIYLASVFCFVAGSHFFAGNAAAQQRFATATAAADALAEAADSEDPAAFSTLLGSDFTQAVSSGDPQADRLGIKQLGTLMLQGYKLSPRGPYTAIIEIGADKWNFPLPVRMTTDGGWAFDAETGKAKLLQRRIEKNEERVIKIAEFYAAAQKQYYAMAGTYASNFVGNSVKKDGLYWETGPDGIASPLEPLVSRARNLGYEKQGKEEPILTGYNFRVLTAQGEYAPGKTQSYFDAAGNMTKGFALLAYPSRYGVSGKMSFIVGGQSIVYSRDLGARTAVIGEKIKQFDPDPSWHTIAGNLPDETVRIISTSDGAYPFIN